MSDDARLYQSPPWSFTRCRSCGAWSPSQWREQSRCGDGVHVLIDGQVTKSYDRAEVLPADSVTGLVEALRGAVEAVEILTDPTRGRMTESEIVAELERFQEVALPALVTARKALASLPTQPEPEQGGSGGV